MNFTLHLWRQEGPEAHGRLETHEVSEIDPHASFLEMMDILNDDLLRRGERPIAFDQDCREGICGSCDMLIDGLAHGPGRVTTCQIYMRDFADGAEITVEPFRASAFPVQRDLVVDRSALDRVAQAGGYVSVTTGPKPEPNANPVAPETAQEALDASICIGCGACVAACPNGAAVLYTGAKVSHLSLLPQGQPERAQRVQDMVHAMDDEGFGGCSNHGECQAVCPQGISIKVIGDLNREYFRAVLTGPRNRREAQRPQ